MKKTTMLALCLTLILINVLYGCAQSAEQTTPTTAPAEVTDTVDSTTESPQSNISAPGEMPISNEIIEMTCVIRDNPTVYDWATNDATKWLEEKTNIHFTYDAIPDENIEEQLNLILTSGDLPDVFYSCRINNKIETEYGAMEGFFIPLNDLIEKHGYYFKESLNEYDYDVLGIIRNPDGNIYSLPVMSDCFHCMNNMKLWMNHTWLTNLGLSVPTTTDEFYEVLKAFKEKDANGNGDPNDEYGMVGANGYRLKPEQFVLNSFLYYPQPDDFPFSIIKGEVTSVATNDEYKAGLKYLNKLYTEGLFYEASFTQSYDEFSQMTQNPDTAIVGCFSTHNLLGYCNTPYNREYACISPLKGPQGVQYSQYKPFDSITSGYWVITKDCGYPEAAFKYADFLYDMESTMVVRHGLENVRWRYAEEGEYGLDGNPALVITIPIPEEEIVQNYNYDWTGPFSESLRLRLGTGVPPNSDPYSIQGLTLLLYRETKYKMVPYQPDPDDVMSPVPVKYLVDENNQLLTIVTEVLNAVSEYRVRFITGDLDIDAEWDNYVANIESLGLNKWIELYQTAYDRQYK